MSLIAKRNNRPPMPDVDTVIGAIDDFLRTTTGNLAPTARAIPSAAVADSDLSDDEKQTSVRLMRVNHCGEVCAQALYSGQAVTARNSQTRHAMAQAADEERDHLYWTQTRIREFGGKVSHLNPLFYGASFAAGVLAGALGDRVNLGFVAATEAQVCKHLDEHIERLPEGDAQSRAILDAMREDEKQHESTALKLGGARFPTIVKRVMTQASKVMTRSTYWI